jgi:hypothetical protein
MVTMRTEVSPHVTPSTDGIGTPHTVTYVVTAPEDGDGETGTVLLDRRPIGTLRRRRRAGFLPRRPDGSPADESVWHADALGWLPNAGRPWDTRVTRTAPTRRRAAEDLLRAYRSHR